MTESALILPRLWDSVTVLHSQFPSHHPTSSSFAHSVISEEATVKIQFYRSETSTPQQRPAATKWLQWIKSKWNLWINRGAAPVVANDRKMDEPQPAEMASWFALCIPSIPWVWGRGVRHLSMFLAGSGIGEKEYVWTRACPFIHGTLLACLSRLVCHKCCAMDSGSQRGCKTPRTSDTPHVKP